MSNTPNPSTPSTNNSVPLPQLQFTEDDIASPAQLAAKLNTAFNNLTQVVNKSQGYGGPITANNHIDMQGYRLMNVGSPVAANDAVSAKSAVENFSAPVLKPKLESSGSSALISYRQMNNPNQREQNSSWLNDVLNTAPTANTSTITAGSPAGGYIPVTISAGTLYHVDNTLINYPSLTASLPLPSGTGIYYVYIGKRSAELFINPTAYPADTWANRVNSSFDGSTLIGVISLTSGGLDTHNSGAGGTPPSTSTAARLFGRL